MSEINAFCLKEDQTREAPTPVLYYSGPTLNFMILRKRQTPREMNIDDCMMMMIDARSCAQESVFIRVEEMT